METDSVAAKQVFEPSKLIRPADILAHIEENTVAHGLYGWWFDASLPDIPRGGCRELDGNHLLYIGIAPSSKKSSEAGRTLNDRIKNHIGGGIRNSTLRLSLATLLKDDLQFDFQRVGKRKKAKMSRENEAALSNWIHEHAQIAYFEYEAPWLIEDELIARGPMLPLNLKKNHRNPFKKTLENLRHALGRD